MGVRAGARRGQALVLYAQLLTVLAAVMVGLLEFSIAASTVARARQTALAALDRSMSSYLLATITGYQSWGGMRLWGCVFNGYDGYSYSLGISSDWLRIGYQAFHPQYGTLVYCPSNGDPTIAQDGGMTVSIQSIQVSANSSRLQVSVTYVTRLTVFRRSLNIPGVVVYQLRRP